MKLRESLLQIFPRILLLVLFVGMFAGSYPVIMLSSFNPITVLEGSWEKSSQKKRLRNVLAIVQFSLSLILIIVAFQVKSQLDFVRDKEIGFNRAQIVLVPLFIPHDVGRIGLGRASDLGTDRKQSDEQSCQPTDQKRKEAY